MTSRESLALAAVAAPALVAALVVRRAATRRARPSRVAAARRVGAPPRSRWRPSRSPTRRRRCVGDWLVVDAAGGLLVGVIGVVGLASVLVSPAYLRHARRRARPARHAATRLLRGAVRRSGRCSLAVPLVGNLGAAWLLVEATTAASALLVGFSGKPRALEAGWKYLVLTSLGLGVALLGIVAARRRRRRAAALDALVWRALAADVAWPATRRSSPTCCSLAGLAAKIGWAPVHNWLPDAHSEAPPPVSALLSAALLPTVLLVAWRSSRRSRPASASRRRRSVLDRLRARLARRRGAVPLAAAGLEAAARLLEPRAHGRDRARHRLRHPLALAGVAVHVAGHALAKALGFYAATPLLGHEPRAARPRRSRGIGAHAARRSARRSGSRSARSPACRPRRSSSARC